MLCGGVTRFRRAPVPSGGIGQIGENPTPAGVEQCQPIAGLGICGRRRGGPRLQRSGVILPRIGIGAALNDAPRLAGKADHGSRIASLTLRITPLSTYMKTERDPTLMSAFKVMPGTSLKLSGTALSLVSVSAMRAL